MARRIDTTRVAQKREQIALEAGRLFATRGYDHTSAAQVAQAVGTSPASIFYYFKDKAALFRAVFERDLPAAEALVAAYRDVDDPLTAILDILEALAEDAADPSASGLLVELLRRVEYDPELVELVTRTATVIRDGLADLIARAIADGDVDPTLDPTRAAVWLQTLVDAVYLNARPGCAPQTELRRTALGYLTAPDPRPGRTHDGTH